MTPTLPGRLQTRLALAVAVGVPVVLVLALLLDGLTVRDGLGTLAGVTALGLGWELLYQRLQQLRWDRDWPSIVALAAGLPEALVSWPLLALLGLAPGFGTHVLLVGTVWLASWLVLQGPVKVLLPHWRFQGMRLLPEPTLVRRTAQEAAATPEPAAARRTVGARLRGAVALDLTPGARQRLLAAGALAVITGAVLWIGAPDRVMKPNLADGPHYATLLGPGDAQDSRDGHADAASAATWDTTARVTPRAVQVSAGGSQAVQPLGLTTQGRLKAPDAGRVGWYADGAAPGQRGPAVLAGSTTDVFAGLGTLTEGDRVTVQRTDGSEVLFSVQRVEKAKGSAFPTQEVYGPTPRPELRLVGYAGSDYVIVFAQALSLETEVAHG